MTDNAMQPEPIGLDTSLRDVVVVLFAEGIIAAALIDLVAPWPNLRRLVLASCLVAAVLCMIGIRYVPWRGVPRALWQAISLSALLLAIFAIAATGGWTSPFMMNVVLIISFAAFVGPRSLALGVATLASVAVASPFLYDGHPPPLMTVLNVAPTYLGLVFWCIWRPQPDLILLDMMLPGVMDGLRLLRVVRSSPDAAVSQLPTVMLTAVAAAHKVKEAIALGATNYLLKPVDLQMLVARIEQELRKRPPRCQVGSALRTAGRLAANS